MNHIFFPSNVFQFTSFALRMRSCSNRSSDNVCRFGVSIKPVRKISTVSIKNTKIMLFLLYEKTTNFYPQMKIIAPQLLRMEVGCCTSRTIFLCLEIDSIVKSNPFLKNKATVNSSEFLSVSVTYFLALFHQICMRMRLHDELANDKMMSE